MNRPPGRQHQIARYHYALRSRGFVRSIASRQTSGKLPQRPVRARFAPSPTGNLHLGSLRTALYNFLLAKRTGGQFILRIEDTDQKRTVPGAEQRLINDLRWAGLQWDEGPEVGGPYGPYRQSERTSIYRAHSERLLGTGHAYQCFCTAARLSRVSEERARFGLPPNYDRSCAHLPDGEVAERTARGESYVIRLRSPSQYPGFEDLIHGFIKPKQTPRGVDRKFFDDPVLLKSDGSPTYHLANVVDDHLMDISHVVRAAEWLPSTPKHVQLYHAFGWKPPHFVHAGLLTDPAGQKLSKRKADIDCISYMKEGVLPESLVNFVALLGWSHSRKEDRMSMEQLIENFDLKLTKGNTIVTPQKLAFLQKSHAESIASKEDSRADEIVQMITKAVSEHLSAQNLRTDMSVRELSARLFKLEARNYRNAPSFVDRYAHFYLKGVELLPTTSPKETIPEPLLSWMSRFLVDFNEVTDQDWLLENLQRSLLAKGERLAELVHQSAPINGRSKVEPRQLTSYFNRFLRWALTGGRPGPSIINTLILLGPAISRRRLAAAQDFLSY